MQHNCPTIRIRDFIIILDDNEQRQEIALMKAIEKQPVVVAMVWTLKFRNTKMCEDSLLVYSIYNIDLS